MKVRRLSSDGSSDVLPNVGEANVGDVIRVEDDGTPDTGSWVWHELTSKDPINTLSITDKSQAYGARYNGTEKPPVVDLETELILESVGFGNTRIMVYISEEHKARGMQFVDFVVWKDQVDVYGVVFNPCDEPRTFLRVMPDGSSSLGMLGTSIDFESQSLCVLVDLPQQVIQSVKERILKKVNNPRLML